MATIVEFIILLPGKAAAQKRREAARLVARYIGADLGAIGECMSKTGICMRAVHEQKARKIRVHRVHELFSGFWPSI